MNVSMFQLSKGVLGAQKEFLDNGVKFECSHADGTVLNFVDEEDVLSRHLLCRGSAAEAKAKMLT